MNWFTSWAQSMAEEGLPIPTIRSPRLGRGDWVLTLMVLSQLATLFIVLHGSLSDADIKPGVQVVGITFLVVNIVAYLVKSMPERRISLSVGAEGVNLSVGTDDGDGALGANAEDFDDDPQDILG